MKIEENVPIPNRRGEKVKTIKAMKIGDSIEIEKVQATTWRSVAHSLNVKVTIRFTSETKARLWKIE